MFCACIGIIICLLIIIAGAAISSVDVVKYDFGLYYILLAIVALMGSLTLCVIRPAKFCGVSDPRWYTNFCEKIHQALLDAQEKRLAAQLRELELAERGSLISTGPTVTSSKKPGGRHQRATLMMLGPAVELMHHVIHGVAENTNEDEEEEEDKSALEVDLDGPSLWWDTYEPSSEQKLPRPKRKKKRRPKSTKLEYDLYTIPSVSSEMATSNCHPPNNTSFVSQLRPCQTTDERETPEDGVSEIFL